jgi:hypothetical protein
MTGWIQLEDNTWTKTALETEPPQQTNESVAVTYMLPNNIASFVSNVKAAFFAQVGFCAGVRADATMQYQVTFLGSAGSQTQTSTPETATWSGGLAPIDDKIPAGSTQIVFTVTFETDTYGVVWISPCIANVNYDYNDNQVLTRPTASPTALRARRLSPGLCRA